MNTILLISLFILGLGYLGKRKLRGLESESEGDMAPRKQSPTPAFESLFEEAPAKESPSSFEDEASAAGYFSYETVEDEAVASPKETDSALNPVVMHVASDELEEEGKFNLRQAIIYETILHNKFLPIYSN